MFATIKSAKGTAYTPWSCWQRISTLAVCSTALLTLPTLTVTVLQKKHSSDVLGICNNSICLSPFHADGLTHSFGTIRVKLDDGTQSFLRDVSRSMLETALPEEAEDLRTACESAAGGISEDASRSIMETANRLAQLKNGVLEPMLCQVLTQQVVG